jgi:hypothetical protein
MTMRAGIKSFHWNDANGNPAGGTTFGNGFSISWQNGPLGRHAPACCTPVCTSPTGPCNLGCVDGCTRVPPNGTFVEDVIEAAVDRLRYYQESRFACDENAKAIAHLTSALAILDARTKNREARAVEGTHKE